MSRLHQATTWSLHSPKGSVMILPLVVAAVYTVASSHRSAITFLVSTLNELTATSTSPVMLMFGPSVPTKQVGTMPTLSTSPTFKIFVLIVPLGPLFWQMMSLQDFLCLLPVLRFWESSPSHFVSHFCMSGSPNWAWHFPISRWNQMKWLPGLIPARHVCLWKKEDTIILIKNIYTCMTCMLFIFRSIGIMTRSKVCLLAQQVKHANWVDGEENPKMQALNYMMVYFFMRARSPENSLGS